ncbi:hypothetical protein KQX54_007487 [Cotesia glomerata]|uniref:Uncharacterized protein n=1 Tax=Cotesia glomerata TaxID=32391 RepID=A0AAV7I7T5_COTGL|nr:hypothetical protein KQX54_007487 [Cotesia glomerata]
MRAEPRDIVVIRSCLEGIDWCQVLKRDQPTRASPSGYLSKKVSLAGAVVTTAREINALRCNAAQGTGSASVVSMFFETFSTHDPSFFNSITVQVLTTF